VIGLQQSNRQAEGTALIGRPAQPTEFLPTQVADNLVEMIRSKRLTLKQVVETFEKTLIQQAAKNSPELTKVELAKALGLPRRTLYYKLDEHTA